MKRFFPSFSQKVPVKMANMQKDKVKRIRWMFAIGLTGCAFSAYAKYVNTEIDVVFEDTEMMQYVVPQIPALYRVGLYK